VPRLTGRPVSRGRGGWLARVARPAAHSPRGWHLEENHLFIDGVPTSASLFDFGLYFFHNARQTLQIGIGPYFYLPKMESHLEAR